MWLLLTALSCMQVILAVGTKLQAIIAMMAIEITERHTVIQGMPVVKLSDDHFWFRKPRFVFQLIHFASFQVSRIRKDLTNQHDTCVKYPVKLMHETLNLDIICRNE
jgi:hypothetical protein